MIESNVAGSSWWVRHVKPLKTIFRVLIGIAWLADGILKFTSGFVNSFLGAVQAQQQAAPGWLAGWFSFWATQAASSGTAIVYTVGVLEIALGLALLTGFMRKVAYAGGAILGLLIWAVPEGFGGPYQAGGGGTDIGTGIMYTIAFLGLIIINATYGPSRLSLDFYIERRFPGWARIAEFGTSLKGRSNGGARPS